MSADERSLLAWVARRLSERTPHQGSGHIAVSSPLLTEGLVTLAIERELAGLIYELTPTHQRESLPQSATLKRRWLDNLSADLARGHALAQAWPDELPAPLLIKGADLCAHVYPVWGLSAGARPSSDWDMLIPSPLYEEVAQVWRQRFGSPTTPRSARAPHEPPHELGFSIDGLLFELHRDPAPTFFSALSGQELWDHALSDQAHKVKRGDERKDERGPAYLAPNLTDRLLIWLVNYAKAGGAVRLLAWIDLTLLFRLTLTALHTHSERAHQMMAQIDRAGLTRAYQRALNLWLKSPLADQLDSSARDTLRSLTRGSSMTALHKLSSSSFERRCTWESSKIRVAWSQVSMCAPRLRWAYLSRAVRRALRERLSRA